MPPDPDPPRLDYATPPGPSTNPTSIPESRPRTIHNSPLRLFLLFLACLAAIFLILYLGLR